MFRTKQMELSEWGPFQEHFGAAFVEVFHGHKGMALFLENGPAGEARTLLIPADGAEVIEALSPGGWQDCGDARERKWLLLVGNASAFEDFRLSPPDIPG